MRWKLKKNTPKFDKHKIIENKCKKYLLKIFWLYKNFFAVFIPLESCIINFLIL